MKAYSKIHPLVKLLFYIVLLLTTMFISHPVIHFTALTGGVVLCAFLFEKTKTLFSSAIICVIVYLSVVVSNPFISRGGSTVLFTVFHIDYTLESLLYGVDMATMIVAVMIWCACMNKTVSTEDISFIFGRFAPKFSMLLSMTMRFIPLLCRRWTEIQKSQRLSEVPVTSLAKKAKSKMRAFSVLISWSLENAVITARSMKARHYGGGKRTAYHPYRFRTGDLWLLLMLSGLFSVVLAGSISGCTLISYYPAVTAVGFTPMSTITYICFGLMAFTPSVCEGKEALLWKYYKSKI